MDQLQVSESDVDKVESLLGTDYNYSEVTQTTNSKDKALTQMQHHDKSEQLYQLLKESKSLLGELQHSFLHFVLLEDFKGYKQWQKLLEIITKSESGPFTDVFFEFIPVLYSQLTELPQEPEVETKFITDALESFFSITKHDQKLQPRLKALQQLAKKKLGFVTVEERMEHLISKKNVIALKDDLDKDEDLPQVVDLDEQYYF